MSVRTGMRPGDWTGTHPRMRMMVCGRWSDSLSGEVIDVVNPANGQVIGSVPRGTSEDIDVAVAAARAAFQPWREATPERRCATLMSIAADVEAEADAIATLLAQETGNALRTQSAPEVGQAVAFLRYFAGAATSGGGTTTVIAPRLLNYTIREPLGVVAAVIPWNSPVALAVLKIAMALCMGNTVVLKASEEAPLAVLHLAGIISRHTPPGLVNVVTGYGPECGAALMGHPGVDKLSFTGSTAVGKEVMHAAARRVLPVSLELGGKNPAIVFPDSDDDDVARGVIGGMRFGRQGQSCTAGSRLFVHEDVFDSFLDRLARQLSELRVGDPLDTSSDMGALINHTQYERVRAFVLEAVAQGGELRFGREPALAESQTGLFMSPVVLTGVDPTWRVCREEIFGPVLVALPWSDRDDVVAAANDSHYGLAAYVWCRDLGTALRTAHAIDSGWVQVNRGLGQATRYDLRGIQGERTRRGMFG